MPTHTSVAPRAASLGAAARVSCSASSTQKGHPKERKNATTATPSVGLHSEVSSTELPSLARSTERPASAA
jgi:hypothetical protein